MYFHFKFEKIKSCISVTLRQRLTEFGLMSHQGKKSLQILNMMSDVRDPLLKSLQPLTFYQDQLFELNHVLICKVPGSEVPMLHRQC